MTSCCRRRSVEGRNGTRANEAAVRHFAVNSASIWYRISLLRASANAANQAHRLQIFFKPSPSPLLATSDILPIAHIPPRHILCSRRPKRYAITLLLPPSKIIHQRLIHRSLGRIKVYPSVRSGGPVFVPYVVFCVNDYAPLEGS